mmetsp:Transcript_1133/g.4354  ORF Transcript_1133/g.4354 Transcript_1133/m.4354 type:complete len:228 (-) Transcript_1133:128-811(-)
MDAMSSTAVSTPSRRASRSSRSRRWWWLGGGFDGWSGSPASIRLPDRRDGSGEPEPRAPPRTARSANRSTIMYESSSSISLALRRDTPLSAGRAGDSSSKSAAMPPGRCWGGGDIAPVACRRPSSRVGGASSSFSSSSKNPPRGARGSGRRRCPPCPPQPPPSSPHPPAASSPRLGGAAPSSSVSSSKSSAMEPTWAFRGVPPLDFARGDRSSGVPGESPPRRSGSR